MASENVFYCTEILQNTAADELVSRKA